MMPSPFSRNHFHPQQGHLDHKLTQCYDISSGKQKYAKFAPNDLLWVMQGVMTSWTLPNTHQLTPVQQSTSIFGYLPVPVNSADSTEFTGTFTIPHL